MYSTLFDSTSLRHAAQHLCQGTSRCTPAGINKCTSVIAPTSGASCNKSQHNVAPGTTSIAPGTGIFFCHSECNSTAEFSIFRLAHLATVACDSEKSDLRHADSRKRTADVLMIKPEKAVKKRRTPRRNHIKTYDNPMHIPELAIERPNEGAWSAFSSTAQSQTQAGQENEHSIDSSKSTRTIGAMPCETISCDLASTSGTGRPGPAMSSLVEENQSPPRRPKFAGPSSGAKKGRRKPETRVERYARTILKFVGAGSVPEKLIRLTLGNNPDTSKALRLLLAHKKLKRMGEGGKGSAYLYLATPLGLEEIAQMTVEDETICQMQQA